MAPSGMAMMPPMPMMMPSPAIPGVPGQNVVFCYNPLLVPPPMRMMVPLMTPPLMVPMQMPPPPAAVAHTVPEPTTPLDLSKKLESMKAEKVVKVEASSGHSNGTVVCKDELSTDNEKVEVKEENLDLDTTSKPCYKKNMLKRYRGRC